MDKAAKKVGNATLLTAIIFIVISTCLICIYIPLRHYLDQASQVRQLEIRMAQVEAEKKYYEEQLTSWSDDNYVTTKARERLKFIRPGETAIYVTDLVLPEREAITFDTNPETVHEFEKPWYVKVGDSFNALAYLQDLSVTSDPKSDAPPNPTDSADPKNDDTTSNVKADASAKKTN